MGEEQKYCEKNLRRSFMDRYHKSSMTLFNIQSSKKKKK